MENKKTVSALCAVMLILSVSSCAQQPALPDTSDTAAVSVSSSADLTSSAAPETAVAEETSAGTSIASAAAAEVSSETTLTPAETSVTASAGTTETPAETASSASAETTSAAASAASSHTTVSVITASTVSTAAAAPVTAAVQTSAAATSSSAEKTSAAATSSSAVLTSSAKETTSEADTEISASEPEKADPDEFDFHIRDRQPVFTYTDQVEFDLDYIGDDEEKEYMIGGDYAIDKLIDGKWTEVFCSVTEDSDYETLSCEQPGYILTVFFDDEDPDCCKLTAGNYRLHKNIAGADLYAEFEVVQDGENVAGRNGFATLIIDSVEEDMFICKDIYEAPEIYLVVCDMALYRQLFCVGDTVEITYSVAYDLGNGTYKLMAEFISEVSNNDEDEVDYKPVIYLYPQERTKVSVELGYRGELIVTEPEYGSGWKVTADPDGTLVTEDGHEYEYLFWEGRRAYNLVIKEGFCVSGSMTEGFLREKLPYLGLNEKETEEFLAFWLPRMKNNKYNVISFAGNDYTDNARLNISPAPATVIRVFMKYTQSESFIDIPEQHLSEAPERNGFTVVEWGGGKAHIASR